MMYKIIYFFQERWKYLLVSYVAFYLISLINTGVPSLSYLIPIKMSAFGLGWMLGNGLYECRDDMRTGNIDRGKSFYLAVKYSISAVVIIIPIFLITIILCQLLGISDAPFMN